MFRSKVLHATAYAVVAAASVFVLLTAWLLIWPIDPGTEIKSITLPETVVAGSTVEATVEYCKNIAGPAVSTYTLVTEDQLAFYTAPIESNRPVGCDTAVIQVTIPLSAPAGEAHYDVDVQREYNPLHSDTVSATSNEFKILPQNHS